MLIKIVYHTLEVLILISAACLLYLVIKYRKAFEYMLIDVIEEKTKNLEKLAKQRDELKRIKAEVKARDETNKKTP